MVLGQILNIYIIVPKIYFSTNTLFGFLFLSLFLLLVKAALWWKLKLSESMAKPPKKHIFLFYCEECEELAQKVAAQSDSITLQTIKWRSIPFPLPLNANFFVSPQITVCISKFSGFSFGFQFLTVVFYQLVNVMIILCLKIYKL